MSPELGARLRANYPLIFTAESISDPGYPDLPAMPSAFASWGFECGDGWFDLIDALCATLQNATANGAPQVVATQVKEKFGVLRFYANGHNAVQEGMIELAEIISSRLCEVCGNRGRVIRDEWIRTRCPEHEQN
ncbi:hypothetical protein FSB08_14155 [Paraburkholderia sp. JPY432]|uniref:hypothetical protein n=1 Tax=Paraburkholderia youngii TaxID=2782701 RepID=UPI0015958A10|nr:hypothetical protein [Paraburkholderia youngii]NVH73679.1 hypothetical protein [Paraburkholderia youngii]